MVEGRSRPVSWSDDLLSEEESNNESSANNLTRFPLLDREGRFDSLAESVFVKWVLRALNNGFLGYFPIII